MSAFEECAARVAAELQDASAEIARLSSLLRWEQNRAERIGTHGPGCWAWGPTHYECALCRIEELLAENARLKDACSDAERDASLIRPCEQRPLHGHRPPHHPEPPDASRVAGGGWDDNQYRCSACGHNWWFEWIDS